MVEYEVRPWGEFWVLEDAPTHKVKRISVNPGGILSLQYHNKRSEVWTIISGIGTVTLNDEIRDYAAGETVLVAQGVLHRIANKTTKPVTFIEVQYGSYFGEDDIVRVKDEYNRS